MDAELLQKLSGNKIDLLYYDLLEYKTPEVTIQ